MDGLLLVNLSDEELKNELGVSSALHRKKILLTIQKNLNASADDVVTTDTKSAPTVRTIFGGHRCE